MASEDVITLGSSDEESEPAPKKSKPSIKQPPPNAMVCIPRKIHGVTIKPTKLGPHPGKSSKPGKSYPKPGNSNTVQLPQGIGKGVVVKKVFNPEASKLSVNSLKALNSNSTIVALSGHKLNGEPIKFPPPVMKNIQSNNMRPKTVTPLIKVGSNLYIKSSMKPNPMATKTTNLKNPLAIHKLNTMKGSNVSPLNILPPSITVKKATTLNQPIFYINRSNMQSSIPEEITVLDDDEVTPAVPTTASPQWYLSPEEPGSMPETSSKEEENNKEPEPTKMIEITIEDSPLKPIQNKRTHEVGADLAITIDDSPVKPPADSKEPNSGSDIEDQSSIERQSKKKLEYPQEAESSKSVEIVIEPYIMNVDKKNTTFKVQELGAVKSNEAIEKATLSSIQINEPVQKSPAKSKTLTSKDDTVVSSSSNEFHPVYQSFIDLCFELENSDDMKKIVEKKIRGYYLQVPKTYTESEEFIDMVSSKIDAMKAGPEKMYLYIKDIVDELNMQRKMAKAQAENKVLSTNTEDPEPLYGEESEYDTKRQRQIRKLEKTIKKLSRTIQKLEEQEVDFDDEDVSVYLLTERYKERMVRVYAKFCQLTNTKMPSEPRIQIDARPGQPSGPAKLLEKLINKKVPIGTPLPFPDFHDVLRCVREANDGDKLGWNEADIMEEARDLFTRCGKKMQRRRQENEWRLAASRIALDVIDPAEKNNDLKNKLDENMKLASTRENEVFKKYADRQYQLKLEAEEIGDKEAEESPVESEEEEPNDDSVLLEDKEKRKERLKRLIQKKSKKSGNGKENQLSKQIDNKETENNDTEKLEQDSNIKLNPETEEAERLEEFANESTNTVTLTVSDDSYNLDSDIDELHLLQKLHSGKSESSSVDTSDSETPIAISDTLESSDENKKQFSDVISIENSSYSEGEPDEQVSKTKRLSQDSVQTIHSDSQPDEDMDTAVGIDKNVDAGEEPTHNINTSGKINTTNNEEYNESVEDILLASSGEDDDKSQYSQENPVYTSSVNLRDVLISIEDTVVGNTDAGSDTTKKLNDGLDVANSEKVTSESNQSTDEGCSTRVSDVVELVKSDDNLVADINEKQYEPKRLTSNSDENSSTEESVLGDLIVSEQKSTEGSIDNSLKQIDKSINAKIKSNDSKTESTSIVSDNNNKELENSEALNITEPMDTTENNDASSVSNSRSVEVMDVDQTNDEEMSNISLEENMPTAST